MMATVLLGLVMLVGLVGVVVPFLPGTALILGAGVVWAVFVADDGVGRWAVVAVMTSLFVVGAVAKYVLPGRMLTGRLEGSTLLVGAIGAVVGFVVFPPLGFLAGGILGVYLAEVRRFGPGRQSWRSTVDVLKAIGLGVLAEFTAGVLMVATWLGGLALT